MNLETMLDKCKREQWSVGDLDWNGRPREMSREDEIAIVQYFTDMAGIERLAGALFEQQRRKVEDPTLQKIFATFVRDEVRHAHAAQMLADYYDVHKYRNYRLNPALQRFTPAFVDAIHHLSEEIANAYITAGELILDIALLRSLNDYVGDDMSQKAMDLINRDESRHIAIDFHMIGYYSSREYMEKLKDMPKPPLPQRLKAYWSFANVLWYGAPFFKGVFFEPMSLVDPSGKRLKEAFKRIQLISQKPAVRRSAFVKVMTFLQDQYNDNPMVRMMFGGAIARFMGVDATVIQRLYSEAEAERASRMSYDEMAQEALGAKALN